MHPPRPNTTVERDSPKLRILFPTLRSGSPTTSTLGFSTQDIPKLVQLYDKACMHFK
jgi:hypothetical protein